MRVDKRFDRLVRANPERFDVDALAQEQVRDWQAATQRFPRRLYDAYDLMTAYQVKGDYAEALRLADDALARMAAAKSPDDLYDDVSTALNWVYDARARALRGLGNWEEAEIDLQNAMKEKERGGRNVSNTINLASFQAEFNRPDEAIAVLGPLTEPNSPLSPMGRMVVTAIVHTAALSKGDPRRTKEALDYLREHEADAPWVLQDELVRAGRVDEAAAQLIRLLRRQESRSRALGYVQEYREVPMSPGEQQIARGRRQIVQRSDVRAAVLAVGHIERFSIPRD
jgi:tetratricopeptide (TPR) repeat protein